MKQIVSREWRLWEKNLIDDREMESRGARIPPLDM